MILLCYYYDYRKILYRFYKDSIMCVSQLLRLFIYYNALIFNLPIKGQKFRVILGSDFSYFVSLVRASEKSGFRVIC